jgi:hypothetical protein
MPNQSDVTNKLPNDALIIMASGLSFRELTNLSSVNKGFKEFLQSNDAEISIWEPLHSKYNFQKYDASISYKESLYLPFRTLEHIFPN